MSKSNLNIEKSLTILTRGGGLAFAGLFISKILSYASRLIVARIGPEQYGLLSLALVIFSFSAFIALFGFTACIIRYVSYFHEKADNKRLKGAFLFSFKFTLTLSLIVGFFLFILSDWISLTFFDDIRLSLLLKIFAFVIPFDILRSSFISTMLGFKKVKNVMIAKNIAENISKFILLVILIFLGYGLIGATFAYGLAIFVSFVVAAIYFKKLEIYRIIKSNIPAIYPRKEMLFYAIPLLLASTIAFFISWTDTFMIGYFKEAYDIGIYNAAQPTAQLLVIFPNALLTLALPILTGLYTKKDNKSIAYLLKKMFKWVFAFNFIILLFFLFFSSNILSSLFGSQYVEGYLAFIVLSVAFFTFLLSEVFESMLLASKKTKLILFNTLFVAALNIILNYIFIPKFGILGAALGTTISFVIFALLRMVEVYAFTRIFPFELSILKIIFSGIVSLFVIKWLISPLICPSNIIILLFLAGLMFIINLFMLLILRTIDLYEYDIFLKFQRKFVMMPEGINKFIYRFVKK